MRLSFSRFDMLTKQKFWEQHFVAVVLGKGEIDLTPAGVKTVESIAKAHTYERVCSCLY